MGKIPDSLREIIAWNIRECRRAKFPGRGGCKQCAEAFGVSPQQWSPWENAKRTPDELRLSQIADFFGVTVAYLRQDHRPLSESAPEAPSTAHLAGAGANGQSTGTLSPPFPSATARTPFSCPPCCPLLATWTTADQRRLLWLMEKYGASARDGEDSRYAMGKGG